MVLERHIEQKVTSFVESIGGAAFKLRIDGRNGFPDRTIILPNGVIVFVELKKPRTGKLRPAQIKTIKILEDLGQTVVVSDDADYVCSRLLDILNYEKDKE